jgi:hypothetical protein
MRGRHPHPGHPDRRIACRSISGCGPVPSTRSSPSGTRTPWSPPCWTGCARPCACVRAATLTRRRPSSTPSRCERPRPSAPAPAGSTRARRSTAVCVTWWSTRAGGCWWWGSPPRAFRTVTRPAPCWSGCVACSPVKRPGPHVFEVPPRRWVAERSLSWIVRRRRCVRDYERLPAHHEAMVQWAMIIVMGRRLARSPRPG